METPRQRFGGRVHPFDLERVFAPRQPFPTAKGVGLGIFTWDSSGATVSVVPNCEGSITPDKSFVESPGHWERREQRRIRNRMRKYLPERFGLLFFDPVERMKPIWVIPRRIRWGKIIPLWKEEPVKIKLEPQPYQPIFWNNGWLEDRAISSCNSSSFHTIYNRQLDSRKLWRERDLSASWCNVGPVNNVQRGAMPSFAPVTDPIFIRNNIPTAIPEPELMDVDPEPINEPEANLVTPTRSTVRAGHCTDPDTTPKASDHVTSAPVLQIRKLTRSYKIHGMRRVSIEKKMWCVGEDGVKSTKRRRLANGYELSRRGTAALDEGALHTQEHKVKSANVPPSSTMTCGPKFGSKAARNRPMRSNPHVHGTRSGGYSGHCGKR